MASSTPNRKQIADAVRWLLAALCAVVFALTFGLNYGVDNQVVYFLSALRHNDPSLFVRDWYAAEATHYHPVITQLIAPLLRWWPSGWAVAILQVIVVVSGCLGWHAVCRRLLAHKTLALVGYVMVLALISATHALSAGISYLFNEAFQPSAMGSFGLLLAIPLFLSGRWLASGIALGVSGLFHANFLVLNIAAFGLAHLALGGDVRSIAKRLALQFGPSLPALAVLAVPMLATAGGEHSEEARRILFQIRSPHHYTPKAFQADFIPLAAWTVVGVIGGKLSFRGRAQKRMLTLALAFAAVVWMGTLLTSWHYFSRVAQLFVWRLAPFLDLAGQTLFCLGLVRAAWRPAALRRLKQSDWLLLLVGLGALTSAYGMRRPLVTETLLIVCGVGLLGLSCVVATRKWWQRRLPGAALISLLGLGALGALAHGSQPWLERLEERSSLLRERRPQDQQLYDWVAKHTSRDALFLTPPLHQSFRFDTQRAIVVDWKATPMLPEEVVEWFGRLEDVTGKKIRHYRDLHGYDDMTVERVRRLRDEYGFDYVVVFRKTQGRLKGLKRVFGNQRWAVFDVRER